MSLLAKFLAALAIGITTETLGISLGTAQARATMILP